MKYASLYVIVYFILSVISYILLSYEKNTKINNYIESKTKSYSRTYNVFYSKYESLSNLAYDTVINTKDVKDIFKRASSASLENVAREDLKAQLRKTYSKLKKFNIKQLHFHLPNNESFLRFHRPNKFGDDLTHIRQTVSYVNKYKKPIDGFEEGKIYNGYRFVYPLFDKKDYLGSVEVSYSTVDLNKDFISTYKVNSIFLVLKDIVEAKLFEDEKSNYIQSRINGFCLERTMSHETNSFSIFTNNTLQYINEHIKSDTSFSIYNDDTHQIVTFIKVQNPVTKQVVAVWIIGSNAPYIFNKTLNFYVLFILTNFLIIGILSFIYRKACYRELLEKKIKEEVELSREKDRLLIEQTKKSEKKLNKSLQLFGANVIASNTDLKGNITYASEALCKISGYSEDELLGQAHSLFRHPDMPESLYQDLWATIVSAKTWYGEIKNRKKNGGYYWVRTTIEPDLDKNNNIIGYRSIRQDITHEKAKEEFMANMSHELRTPLNAIIGFSNILNKKIKDKEYLVLTKQIFSNSKSLLNLVNNLLDLSKIQDSSFTIEPFRFNAYEEFSEFSQQFEGLTAKKTLYFEIELSQNLKAIFLGDWHRINQICLNLISNAVKFTPKDGTINFKGEYRNGEFLISVSDNGIGMNKEVQGRVFQAFEQADGSTTRKYGGTGLGLSITQKLIELMNGNIDLVSEENKGTTFKVTIPTQKIEENISKENVLDTEDEEKENTLQGHILIVEDNQTNQMLVKMLIEGFGLTCDFANDGVEAVNMYNPLKHILILMDENMPNMNGIEAMKILQGKYKEKCGIIIALTANAMEGDREKFISLGMDEYISKPIDEDELYMTLKKFL